MGPGDTQLTRMPSRPTCCESCLAYTSSDPLSALYACGPPNVSTDAVVVMKVIAPPPPSCISGTTTSHPLVDGIEPFEADDEIYLCRFFGEHQRLLETSFSGTAEGFEVSDWRDNDVVPIMYLRQWGNGEVLYLNLGHARGRYDMQPLMEEYPDVERGSWQQPAFYELLRRGIDWTANETMRKAA